MYKIFVLLTILAFVTFGTNYYVSTEGSDAADGSISTPWKSLDFALCGGEYHCSCVDVNPTLPTAGDTIFLMGGRHPLNYGTPPDGGIEIRYGGTYANKIVLRSLPGEIDTIYGNGIRNLIDLRGNDWVFDSLVFEGTLTPTEQFGLLRLGTGLTCYRILVKNCVFSYPNYDAQAHANTSGICVESLADSIVIENCQFIVVGRIMHGIQIFQGSRVMIRNNYFDSVSTAVFYKHKNLDSSLSEGTCFKYNFVKNPNHMIHGNPAYVDISNNICTGSLLNSVNLGNNGGHDQGEHCMIVHNTLVGPGNGISIELENPFEGPVTYMRLQDNVFVGRMLISAWITGGGESQNPHYTSLDYNIYPDSGSNTFDEFDGNYSLTSWKAHNNDSIDQNSVTGEPTFENLSGNLNVPTDFRLTPLSDGYLAASDGLSMGANVDSVGLLDWINAVVYDTISFGVVRREKIGVAGRLFKLQVKSVYSKLCRFMLRVRGTGERIDSTEALSNGEIDTLDNKSLGTGEYDVLPESVRP